MLTPLSTMRNIGTRTEDWLHAVGVHTAEDLHALGPVEAYHRLKAAFPNVVTLNALWSLEGALLGLDWRDIPAERKAELQALIEARD